jgi:glyoxylase-like metal-dependent hydrolase (beta-lactamase superfamily II)
MELYNGSHLIECEFGGRPLYIPLLLGDREAVLLDCGAKCHAARDIPAYLENLRISVDSNIWLVITHPDVDHCGGAAELARRYQNLQLLCGQADRPLVESPEYLFKFRYDHYRVEHDVFYDEATATDIQNNFAGCRPVSLALVGGETLRLGPDRILEVLHLPGHSHGHLGVYDRKHLTLYYGDAIQGKGYKSLTGKWALCPTYLYVEDYLQTISLIERLGADTIVGCHWPVWHGREEIAEFCTESRNFVTLTNGLVTQYLERHPSGASLAEICDALGNKLGEWPASVNIELAYALVGHLELGLSRGTVAVNRSVRPVIYRRS